VGKFIKHHSPGSAIKNHTDTHTVDYCYSQKIMRLVCNEKSTVLKAVQTQAKFNHCSVVVTRSG